MIQNSNEFRVGGWLYCPLDYDGEARIYTIIGNNGIELLLQFSARESIDNGHWSPGRATGQWTSLWSIESTLGELEEEKIFYVPLSDNIDEMMKQVLIYNLKYKP